MKRIGDYVYDEEKKNYFKIDKTYQDLERKKAKLKKADSLAPTSRTSYNSTKLFLNQFNLRENVYEEYTFKYINYSTKLSTKFNFVSNSFLQYSIPCKFECIINTMPVPFVSSLNVLSFDDSPDIDYLVMPTSLSVEANQKNSIFQWLVKDELYIADNRKSTLIVDCSDPDFRRVRHEMSRPSQFCNYAEKNFNPKVVLYKKFSEILVQNIENESKQKYELPKWTFNFITHSDPDRLYISGYKNNKPTVEKIDYNNTPLRSVLHLDNFKMDPKNPFPSFIQKADDNSVVLSYANGSFKIYDERRSDKAVFQHVEGPLKDSKMNNIFKRKVYISQTNRLMAIQTGCLEDKKIKLFNLTTGQALNTFSLGHLSDSIFYPFSIAFQDIDSHKYQSPKLYIFDRNNIYICR